VYGTHSKNIFTISNKQTNLSNIKIKGNEIKDKCPVALLNAKAILK